MARSKSTIKFLWITDPWETLDHDRDTTLRLAQESIALGHENFWCDVKSIRFEDGDVFLDAQKIISMSASRESASIQLKPLKRFRAMDFDSLQYRTDPPVDLAYQHPLQLLHLAVQTVQSRRRKPEIVNPVAALFLSNEKLEASLLKGLLPPTVIASQFAPLERFGAAEGKAVLKPLHLAQSKGVELLDWSTPEGRERARTLLKSATENFERPVLLQRYLPQIADGETRLWFLDGKLLACAKKLPLKGDFRVNIDQGSGLAPHRLLANEKKAAALIGRRLRELKVRLAAVDLIAGYATDFNITSPGLITQMEKVTGINLARPIISALARKRS